MYMMEEFLVVIIGGMIDKIYFDDKLDYQIGDLQIGMILCELGVMFCFNVILILCKDLLYINDEDCELICVIIVVQLIWYVLVIYGIDLMVQIGKVLVMILDKMIVMIGVLSLVCFRGLDVEFNIGCVIGVVQLLLSGVYIVMNGWIFDLQYVCKNVVVNCFELV